MYNLYPDQHVPCASPAGMHAKYLAPSPPPNHQSYRPQLRLSNPGLTSTIAVMTQRLALHDVGPQAEGVAFSEENSHIRAAVVEDIV